MRLSYTIDGSAPTVSGVTLGDQYGPAVPQDDEVVRPVDRPHSPTGGLAVLFGNLAPRGAVVKEAAVLPQMLRHRGPAQVFDGEASAVEAIACAGGRVTGVRTTAGEIACAAVVNAAGAWAAEVGALAGVRIPVAPGRGQIVLTEAAPRFTNTSAFSMNTARKAAHAPARPLTRRLSSVALAMPANRRQAVQPNQPASAKYAATKRSNPPTASHAWRQ